MKNNNIIKLPTKVIFDSDWRDDIDTTGLEYEPYGGDERKEIEAGAKLVKKSEVEGATLNYKKRKIGIGRVASFKTGDKLAA